MILFRQELPNVLPRRSTPILGVLLLFLFHSIKNFKTMLYYKFKNYDESRCFITHSPADQALVDLVKQSVQEHFKFNEIIETVAGSTVTSHCGYNTIGVIFYVK